MTLPNKLTPQENEALLKDIALMIKSSNIHNGNHAVLNPYKFNDIVKDVYYTLEEAGYIK